MKKSRFILILLSLFLFSLPLFAKIDPPLAIIQGNLLLDNLSLQGFPKGRTKDSGAVEKDPSIFNLTMKEGHIINAFQERVDFEIKESPKFKFVIVIKNGTTKHPRLNDLMMRGGDKDNYLSPDGSDLHHPTLAGGEKHRRNKIVTGGVINRANDDEIYFQIESGHYGIPRFPILKRYLFDEAQRIILEGFLNAKGFRTKRKIVRGNIPAIFIQYSRQKESPRPF